MNRGLNEKESETNKVNQLQKTTGRGIVYRRIVNELNPQFELIIMLNFLSFYFVYQVWMR